MRHLRQPSLGQASLGTLALILAAAVASPAGAQQYFGQNQVQFDKFKWKVKETAHFTIHFYPEERESITDVARMAESRLLAAKEVKPILPRLRDLCVAAVIHFRSLSDARNAMRSASSVRVRR